MQINLQALIFNYFFNFLNLKYITIFFTINEGNTMNHAVEQKLNFLKKCRKVKIFNTKYQSNTDLLNTLINKYNPRYSNIINRLLENAFLTLSKNITTQNEYFDSKQDEYNYLFAVCCENGYGTNKDYEKALMYYKKAAKNNHPEALLEIGLCVLYGYYNTKVNKKHGFKLIKKAYEKGCHEALHSLIECYEHGLGTKENINKAVELCEQGSTESENCSLCKFNLGVTCENGQGRLTKDLKRAKQLYFNSHALGNNGATHLLGSIFEHGLMHEEQNLTKALEFYAIAANKGYEPALISYEKLINTMNKSKLKLQNYPVLLNKENIETQKYSVNDFVFAKKGVFENNEIKEKLRIFGKSKHANYPSIISNKQKNSNVFSFQTDFNERKSTEEKNFFEKKRDIETQSVKNINNNTFQKTTGIIDNDEKITLKRKRVEVKKKNLPKNLLLENIYNKKDPKQSSKPTFDLINSSPSEIINNNHFNYTVNNFFLNENQAFESKTNFIPLSEKYSPLDKKKNTFDDELTNPYAIYLLKTQDQQLNESNILQSTNAVNHVCNRLKDIGNDEIVLPFKKRKIT